MPARKRPGPPKGHPGWGGRPRGVTMPCGACGHVSPASLKRSQIRKMIAERDARLYPTDGTV